jgi:molybdenum cofactor guanylyltransferase
LRGTFPYSLAILAGGKNSRFGGANKAFIKIGDKSIIQASIDKLKPIFREIIIVANKPEDFIEFSEYRIITDIYKDKGPLGGLHSALSVSAFDAVFVVPCDMPFLNPGLIKTLLSEFNPGLFDALVPLVNGMVEPLHAIYHKRINHEVKVLLERIPNPSIKMVFEEIRVRYYPVDDSQENKNIFTNINSDDDIKPFY